MMNLTGEKFRGKWGKDYQEDLNKPGKYVIEVVDYDEENEDGFTNIEVDVKAVYLSDEGAGEHTIIAEFLDGKKKGELHMMYYNGSQGCWKYGPTGWDVDVSTIFPRLFEKTVEFDE